MLNDLLNSSFELNFIFENTTPRTSASPSLLHNRVHICTKKYKFRYFWGIFVHEIYILRKENNVSAEWNQKWMFQVCWSRRTRCSVRPTCPNENLSVTSCTHPMSTRPYTRARWKMSWVLETSQEIFTVNKSRFANHRFVPAGENNADVHHVALVVITTTVTWKLNF